MNESYPPHLQIPDSDDDEAMVEFGRQLAIDSLLHEHFEERRHGKGETKQRSVSTNAASSGSTRRATRKRFHRRRVLSVSLILASSFLIGLFIRERTTPNDVPWHVNGVAGAEFRMRKPNVVELDAGEIVVERDSELGAPLIVITPNSRFVTSHGKSVIGSHQLKSNEQGAASMIRPLTRVLVIAGIATLSNDAGRVELHANDLARAINGHAPVAMTVKYNTQFGIDLYREMATDAKNENVFVSPFSVGSALAMLAEGARGQTAVELGNVLRFPDAARRIGNDAELLPWEMSKIYSGIQSLNKILDRTKETPKSVQLRQQADAIRKELNEVRAKLKKYDAPTPEIQKLDTKDRQLQQENRQLYAERKKQKKGSSEYKRVSSQIDEIRQQRNVLREQKNQLREKLMREFVDPLIQKEKQIVSRLNSTLKLLGGYELRIANAIWADPFQPFEQAYVRAVSEAFQTGGLIGADFRNQSQVERDRINHWVAQQTNDRIQNLLPVEAVDHTTAMVLTNAVYFQGDWKSPFKQRYTRPRSFTLADGSEVKTLMMRESPIEDCSYAAINADGSVFEAPDSYDANHAPQLYPDDAGFHMVSLPYRGDEISMVILAPMTHDGLSRLEESLSHENLSQWIGQLKKRPTAVMIPKFKLEQSFDLGETLQRMGLRSAFISATRKGGADFTGISNPPSVEDRLFVSRVVHKTFVDVNEKGTEAAAATGVVEVKSEEPRIMKFIPYFRADRPFLFLIRDNRTGTILFMGRLVKPRRVE